MDRWSFSAKDQSGCHSCDTGEELDRQDTAPMHHAQSLHRAFDFLNTAAARLGRITANGKHGQHCGCHRDERGCPHKHYAIEMPGQKLRPCLKTVNQEMENGPHCSGQYADQACKSDIAHLCVAVS
nr:hypothetical protein [Marinicella sp. W31]MDC2878911.1 hypothetical protein [Marinicella sp. W31]